jgi:NADH-quinone oxidoreductase subunit G
VNEEWISDKTRFVWDGLRRQRLDKPYIRENGKLRPASWDEALAAAATAIRGATKLAGLVGDLVPVEPAFALKELVEGQGGHVECRTDGAKLPAGNRSAYVGNAAIEDIDHARTIYLVGTDPRAEAPVLNARLRKAWLHGATVHRVGPPSDLTFDVVEHGTDRAALRRLVDGAETQQNALVLVGQGALTGDDGQAVLAAAMLLAERTGGGLLVLHTAAGRVGAMDAGCVSPGGVADLLTGADVVYNLGADEIEVPENAWDALPEATLGTGAFPQVVGDFYLTNPIARASQLMAQLSADARARRGAALAAE